MKYSSFAAAAMLCALGMPAHPQQQNTRELTQTEQIAHVLSRLTFGARPGDVERVAALGVNRWIDQQLRPASIPDSALLLALAPLPPWSRPTTETASQAPVVTRTVTTTKDSALKVLTMKVRFLSVFGPNSQFLAGKVIHAQVSERQLEEVLADFWLNHFSVFSGKMPASDALVAFERDAVRPHALGKFRDLLGAVARSPAMLYYLDNHLSRSDSSHRSLTEFRAGLAKPQRDSATRLQGLNENYARELLELHTLGVDGGYTQQDVIEVARALTGRTTSVSGAQVTFRIGGPPVTFQFNDAMHDAEVKTVLGRTLPAGRGIEDGEDVLDILARHPSTAMFVATKLARRFVSDSPPQALIDRAAAAFTRTDGDIAEVVRTIVTSPEFFSRAAFRSKVKTPFELVVSAARALGAPADTTAKTVQLLSQLAQPLFGRQTPDGWPDYGSAWINSGTMLNRMMFGADVAAGRLAFLPTTQWAGWGRFATQSLERQVDGVVNLILAGVADPATRDLLLATATSPDLDAAAASTARLRELIAIALGSPDFQRR